MARFSMRGLALAVALAAVAGPASAAPDTSRLLTIGGSITEIVFALGKGASVIGVDQTSVWPPEVRTLPQIGYYKRVSPEGVLALAPTLVLAYRDAEPASAIRQIEQAGTPVELLDRTPPVKALMDNIGRIGRILGAEEDAGRLAARIHAQLEAARADYAGRADKPRVLFLLNYDPSQMVVAGRDTVAAQLIEMAGGVNAAGDLAGFKPLNAEMVSAAAPDVVLTVEDRWDDMGGAAGMKRLPGMAGTPAARRDRLAALPGPLMLGLGPRIGEAVERLANLIHGTEAVARDR